MVDANTVSNPAKGLTQVVLPCDLHFSSCIKSIRHKYRNP